jgi:hypothetical protein
LRELKNELMIAVFNQKKDIVYQKINKLIPEEIEEHKR